MFRSQFHLMIRKKSFLIAFSIMMAIAVLLPSIYFLLGRFYSSLHDYEDYSLFLGFVGNPYLFYAYFSYTVFFYYLIPVILMFPFSLSFSTEKKCGYYHLLVSRGGIKNYILSKSVCCMIGGFICFFIPAIVNIVANYFLLNEATDVFCHSSYKISNAMQVNAKNGKEISSAWIFSIEHPYLALFRSALLIGVFAAVCSLTIYTFSLYFQKRPYFSAFPLIIILLTFYLLDSFGQSKMTPSVDPLMYACVGYNRCYSITYFICFIVIAIILNYAFIVPKTRKDLL